MEFSLPYTLGVFPPEHFGVFPPVCHMTNNQCYGVFPPVNTWSFPSRTFWSFPSCMPHFKLSILTRVEFSLPQIPALHSTSSEYHFYYSNHNLKNKQTETTRTNIALSAPTSTVFFNCNVFSSMQSQALLTTKGITSKNTQCIMLDVYVCVFVWHPEPCCIDSHLFL